MRIKFTLLLCSLALILSACATSVSGRYKTNHALYGFFGSRLSLKSDSTFNYHFGGDMISFDDSGHYSIKGRDLLLSYYPVNLKIYLQDSLDLSDTSHRSYRFRIGNKKLWFYDKSGKVVKKGSTFSRHHFLFFGQPRKVTRRVYLKKFS